MQDRLKFRVYSKFHGHYLRDVVCFGFDKEKENIIIGLSDGQYWYFKEADIVVEFCTGLKDKLGTLIYEGDIVRYWKLWKWNPQGFIKIVVWCEKSASFRYIDLDKLGADKQKMHTVREPEIIGNIYKNPELLEENLKDLEV